MKINKFSMRTALLMAYAFFTGAILGAGFAFLIIVPLFQLLMAIITGSDRGAIWTNYFVYALFVTSTGGGIYISVRWCLKYLERKQKH